MGVSLLREALRSRNIPCDLQYFQFKYAALIGERLNRRITDCFPNLMLGEWLFAPALFGDQLPDPQLYVDNILGTYVAAHGRKVAEDIISNLPYLRSTTTPFIEDCMSAVPWKDYKIIGFTSTFAQNLSSLALAKRIKETWPDKIIVFGGANYEGEMGAELHRHFQFIDYVCSGEADLLFPELVKRLGANRPVDDLPGLVYRQSGKTIANGSHATPVFDLDALPYPNFDDFFAQLEESGLTTLPADLRLLIETGRGCWWGAKSQCSFCGLNGSTLAFRSKSSDRILEEFTYLAQRYPKVKGIAVVDNIMNFRYFQDVIPKLIDKNPGLSIWYETKSNVHKGQLKQLKQARIESLQPGIESLDSSILHLIHKGCTAVQNIQTLKWAREFGINLGWNLISGFPGEDPIAYQHMAEMIPSLVHFQPPAYGEISRLRLDRFSPYFEQPEKYGIVNLRPSATYRYIYPFSEDSLARLAYHFDFDYADGRKPETYTHPLNEAIKMWYSPTNTGSLLSLTTDGRIILYDTRPTAHQKETVLKGVAKVIYEFCDEGRTLPSIIRYLQGQTDPTISQVDPGTLQPLLTSLIEARLMLYVDNHYLSLAIPISGLALEFIDSLAASQPPD